MVLVERVGKTLAAIVQHGKPIKVLQVFSADIGLALWAIAFGHARLQLALLHHVAEALGQTAEDRRDAKRKAILVGVAERSMQHELLDEVRLQQALRKMLQLWMFRIERHKPVAKRIEKGEALHVGEAAKIDVGPTLLHIRNLLETRLKLLHLPVVVVGVQNIHHRVLLFLLDAKPRNLEVLVLHDVGHDVVAERLLVACRVLAEHHLLLQLQHLLAHLGLGKEVGNPLTHLRKEREPIVANGKHPSHEGPLADGLVVGQGEHLGQGDGLLRIGYVEGGHGDGRHQRQRVHGVDGGRREQARHVVRHVGVPLAGNHNGVEQVAHEVEMRLIELLGALLAHLLLV